MRRSEIARGAWLPPDRRGHVATFGDYAGSWLVDRTLKPRTKAHYRSLLESRILLTFGDVPVRAITTGAVRRWYTAMDSRPPTSRAHAYGLLRAILATAVGDEIITANPCHIRGAGSTKRVHKIRPASLVEIELLVTAMPAKYRAMLLLAAWCGLRFGELTALRRRDVDVDRGVPHVRLGVVRVNGEVIVGTPKTSAGVRDVAIPPHLLPAVEKHLDEHALPGRDELVFPSVKGGHLAPSTLYRSFYAARTRQGRTARPVIPRLEAHRRRPRRVYRGDPCGADGTARALVAGGRAPVSARRRGSGRSDRPRAVRP
jgi:integrase